MRPSRTCTWCWTIPAAAAVSGPKPRLTPPTLKPSSSIFWGGQYNNPVRVVGFNTAERWSQDVSRDVAQELRQRCDLQQRDVPFFLQDFVDRYEGRYSDIQLPLPIRLD
ncbi:MAG: hypothetical protein QOF07_1993 [Bradyrhizobium sp.]|jgi:hypothetical protein|nr:hypothetical protein [Bradyrhizobium sp.]